MKSFKRELYIFILLLHDITNLNEKFEYIHSWYTLFNVQDWIERII